MRVVVVAPTALDLVLGCGGYVARMDREGSEVSGLCAVCTDTDKTIEAARMCGYSQLELSKAKEWETFRAAAPAWREWLSDNLSKYSPDIIISPTMDDDCEDHRALAEHLMSILDFCSNDSPRRILGYRSARWDGEVGSVLVRLGEPDQQRKRQASEVLGGDLLRRSVEAKSRWLGSLVGSDYAEEYMLRLEKV